MSKQAVQFYRLLQEVQYLVEGKNGKKSWVRDEALCKLVWGESGEKSQRRAEARSQSARRRPATPPVFKGRAVEKVEVKFTLQVDASRSQSMAPTARDWQDCAKDLPPLH